PRLRTSAMMPRTACSTSSAVSRLVARNAAKRAVKSADRLSRRIGITRCPAGTSPGCPGQWPARAGPSTLFGHPDGFAIDDVAGAAIGGPGRAEIGQLSLQALDLEPERRAAGK